MMRRVQQSPEALAHGQHAVVYAVARKAVERKLDAMWRTFGPGKGLPTEEDREVLEALMDGTQDGWSEWVPIEYRRDGK